MSRRNIVVLLAPLGFVIALVVATLFVADVEVRRILFYAVLITALVVLVTYIFVTWADYERLRSQTAAAIERIRRESAINREMTLASVRQLEEEIHQMRRQAYAQLAIHSTDLEGPEFTDALHRLLDGCDG